jgi:hypothetical protein
MELERLQKKLKDTPASDPVAMCIIQNDIGVYYSKISDYRNSIHHFKQVLVLRNDIPEIYTNMAECYRLLKEYDKAIMCLTIALRLRPSNYIHLQLGALYMYIKKHDESIHAFQSLHNPSKGDLHSTCFPYLASKRFLKGFELYENRLASNDISPLTNQITRLDIPSLQYWNGKDTCNHLLVIYEQGIGDNVQFFRYVIELSKRKPDMQITYFCRTNVSHLFNSEPYENIIVRDDSQMIDLASYDKKIYIMSLPHILKLTSISMNDTNYIKENLSNTKLWKDRLSEFQDKLKVGIVYSGMLVSYIDKNIELNKFKNICNDDRFHCICLHANDEKIKNDYSHIDFKDKLFNYDIDQYKAFFDTIAILRNIDVLITIDTSVAHVAGVMGVKTLLMIGYTSDWRWFDTDDKVWYESVEIIRMTENKPLEYLIPRIHKILSEEYRKCFVRV